MTPLTPCLTPSYALEIPPTLDPITQISTLRSLVNSWNQGQFEYGSQCIQTESVSPEVLMECRGPAIVTRACACGGKGLLEGHDGCIDLNWKQKGRRVYLISPCLICPKSAPEVGRKENAEREMGISQQSRPHRD